MDRSGQVALALLFTLAAMPLVSAGSPDAPELTDAAGDVMVEEYANAAEGPPLVAGVADAVDLQAAWFSDDEVGLHAHIRVADLSALQAALPVPVSDLFWIAIFSPAYQTEEGLAARPGTWELRAEFRPAEDPAWHYWLERPCKAPASNGGCAGEDRDIVDGLPGMVDEAASVITITAPWDEMAGPQAGDGIHGLWATAQADWPTYPARSVDWDTDQGTQCYTFAALPLQGPYVAPPQQALGSSNGRTALPQSYEPAGCASEAMDAGAGDPEVPSADAAAGEAVAGEAADADAAGSPGTGRDAPSLPAVAALMAILGLAVLSRRRA